MKPNQEAINQTIEKIVNYYLCMEQNTNKKIENWLNHDEESLQLVMDLFVQFSRNGWFPPDFINKYADVETDMLCLEIFNRAMTFFKGA